MKKPKRIKTPEIAEKRMPLFIKMVSTPMFLRAVVIVSVLIVATVAICLKVIEPVVWYFLSAVATAAALTNVRHEPKSIMQEDS